MILLGFYLILFLCVEDVEKAPVCYFFLDVKCDGLGCFELLLGGEISIDDLLKTILLSFKS